jgi:hypothetical protein
MYIQNPSMVVKDFMFSSFLASSGRNDGKVVGRQICNSLSIEPSVYPEKSCCTITDFSVDGYCKKNL